MKPRRIDQVVPSFGLRDAIGIHVRHLRTLLRDLGYDSDIWCRGTFPEVRAECRLINELPGEPLADTWWLYHLATGSPLAGLFAARPEPLVVDYHNVTPASYFARWVPWAADTADEGRQELADLAGAAHFAVADSAFNDQELQSAGYPRSVVAPPLFDLGGTEADTRTTEALHRRRRAGGVHWLFVGRLAPSKAQHDLVKALACYRRFIDADVHLDLVGTGMGDAYPAAVRRFAQRLGVADRVHFAGSVEDAALAAHFATADVFVSASEHEGFGIPLVEAMHAGVPVVAFAAAAVPETTGGAALLVEDKSPLHLAEAVHRVVTDPELRDRLVRAGRRRAGEFSLARGRARWEDVLAMATDRPAPTEKVTR